ncbi:hypothetical protein P7H06_25345 [Paenibacillus larvae]|nr:hypothetical protein [Paenibacillus larvae]MDT2262146.1 hypothetical protein [Paenibacillus larvae]MDT2265693.1 hypothetical protein [Paenibacillus larvae]MDT2306180.1 hypothetical protein [Paenibacillus larvae]
MRYVETFYENIDTILKQIRTTQQETIGQAAEIVAETVEKGALSNLSVPAIPFRLL